MSLSFFLAENSLHPHLLQGVVQTSTPEAHLLQAFAVRHLPGDDHLLRATTDLTEISIHIDQEPAHALVPDLALPGVIEPVPGPSPGPDPHQGDAVVEEIALGEMVEEDEEALAIAVTAVMMIGAEAGAVAVEEGGDVRVSHSERGILLL